MEIRQEVETHNQASRDRWTTAVLADGMAYTFEGTTLTEMLGAEPVNKNETPCVFFF